MGSNSLKKRIPAEPICSIVAGAPCLVQPLQCVVDITKYRVEGCDSASVKRIKFGIGLNVMIRFAKGLLLFALSSQQDRPF
jgi:hypothetical protein